VKGTLGRSRALCQVQEDINQQSIRCQPPSSIHFLTSQFLTNLLLSNAVYKTACEEVDGKRWTEKTLLLDDGLMDDRLAGIGLPDTRL
jgi:hypothetical protein